MCKVPSLSEAAKKRKLVQFVSLITYYKPWKNITAWSFS